MVVKKSRKPSPPNFFSKVYELVKCIPAGKVSTYGAIAFQLGSKLSARMVGYALNSAVGSNVPAHRVVNRYGALSGKHHFGHPEAMKNLLIAEGVTFNDNETVVMEKHFYDFKNPQKKRLHNKR